MDIKVTRNNNKLITNWYSKEVSSNRLLNFYSNHPINIIMNTAQSFANKIFTLSDKFYKNSNINRIKSILKENNFPQDKINKIVSKSIQKHFNIEQINNNTTNRPNITISQEPQGYKALPYIKNLSDTMKRRLKGKTDYNITFRSQIPLSNLFTNTKDRIPDNEKNNVIYEINCECGKAYLGQTKRKLKERVEEHKKYVMTNSPKSGLAQHCIEENHLFELNTPKIVLQEPHTKKREFKEACHIFNNRQRTVNIKTDTNIINKNYHSILKKSPKK